MANDVNATIERRKVRINKACELTTMSRRTIYNWMNAGKLEFVTLPSGTRLIFVDSLFGLAPRALPPSFSRMSPA